jgi:hypothetical protein
MNYKTLREFILERVRSGEDFTNDEQWAIKDALGQFVWDIGKMYDHVEGVDPHEGEPVHPVGTSNQNSMTYRLRKAARFDYP